MSFFFFFFRGNEHNFLAVFVQSSKYLGCGFSLDLSFNTVVEINNDDEDKMVMYYCCIASHKVMNRIKDGP